VKREATLYLARVISSLGDWMTFLVVALYLNENFGSDKVAYGFLIASAPSFLISSKAHFLVPQFLQKYVYFFGLILLSVNVLLVTKAESLWQIYAYMLVASIITAVLRPLLDTLTVESFEPDQLDRILTRVGGLTSSILCIAPPIGAAIATNFGYNSVFYANAGSFVVAGLLLMYVFANNRSEVVQNAPAKALVKFTFALKELTFPQQLKVSLCLWYCILILGALINAGEFAAFTEFGYSKSEIGLVIGCWGAGGFIAFTTASVRLRRSSLRLFVTSYGIALGSFFLAPWFLVSCAIFFIGGFFCAKLGGEVRSIIQASIPPDLRSLEVWGLINSRLALINMSVYGSVGFLISHMAAAWIVIPILFVCVLVAASGSLFPSKVVLPLTSEA